MTMVSRYMGKEETGLWLLQDLRKCLQRELQSHNPHQDLVDGDLGSGRGALLSKEFQVIFVT